MEAVDKDSYHPSGNDFEEPIDLDWGNPGQEYSSPFHRTLSCGGEYDSLIPIVPNIPGWERIPTWSGTWLGMWGIVCSELGMIRWREISQLESNPSVVSPSLDVTEGGLGGFTV